MAATHILEDAICEALDPIDRYLAKLGLPVQERPLEAATRFVELCIIEVQPGGGKSQKPGTFADYALAPWFRPIFKQVSAWYRDRYGAALERPERHLTGVVHIVDSPFVMKVPRTSTEPGKPGETFWLCFHDTVRENENPIEWVEASPNLANLPARDVKKAEIDAHAIASRLRAINICLMEMKSADPQVAQLREGVIPSLERAAEELGKASQEHIKAAHWHLQMACELAMKCLAQERDGAFTETHDLFVLYDRLPVEPPFARTELAKLPRWEEMVQLRYGGGASIAPRAAYRSYKAALLIVSGSLEMLERPYRVGNAKFELRQPPWMAE